MSKAPPILEAAVRIQISLFHNDNMAYTLTDN